MRPLLVSMAVLTAGCTLDSSGSESVRTDSAGVQIITNSASTDFLDWEVVPVWAVGGMGDDRMLVSALHDYQLAVGDGQQIYVLDRDSKRVLVFSGEGELTGSVGRQGGGPGEMIMPVSVAVAGDATVVVMDLGKNAFVRWSAEGEIVPELRLGAMPSDWQFSATASGLVMSTLRTGSDQEVERLILLHPSGEDRVIASLARSASKAVDFPSCGMSQITVPPIFANSLRWSGEGDQVVVNSGPEYVLDVYEGGQLVRSIRRQIEPRRVTEELALAQVGDGTRVGDCTTRPIEELQRGYADYVQAVAAVRVAPEGEIWVQLTSVGDEPERVDVFAPDGTYKGTLNAGAPFPSTFLSPDQFLSIETDSLDVPKVVVYRISGE